MVCTELAPKGVHRDHHAPLRFVLLPFFVSRPFVLSAIDIPFCAFKRRRAGTAEQLYRSAARHRAPAHEVIGLVALFCCSALRLVCHDTYRVRGLFAAASKK